MVKEYIVNSKKYGDIKVLLDDEDYNEIVKSKPLRAKYDKTINGFYIYRGLEPVHRIITNCPKGLCVDHINRDTLDNRKCNLRVCTQKENNQNRKVRCTNKTGVPGIHKDKYTGRYIVRIIINGKRYYLGKVDTVEEGILLQERRLANAL